MKQRSTQPGLEELLAEVESGYDLGTVTGLAGIGPSLSLVYRVETSDQKCFLLKRHGLSKGLDELLQEEKILAALNSGGFDLAPRLVQTRGRHAHFCYQEHFWSLFDFVDSDAVFDWTKPNWSAENCQSAGEALAVLHRQGPASLEQPGRDEYLPQELLPVWLDDSLRQARIELSGSGPQQDALAAILKDEARIRQSLERTIQEVNTGGKEFPLVCVHGDYHPGNLLYNNSSVSCIIDFEHAHRNHAGYDLGYAALFFGSRWSPQSQDGSIDKQLVDRLVAGYRKRSELLCAEAGVSSLSFKPYMKLASLLLISWGLDKAANQPNSLRTYFAKAVTHGYRALSVLNETAEGYTYAIAPLG